MRYSEFMILDSKRKY